MGSFTNQTTFFRACINYIQHLVFSGIDSAWDDPTYNLMDKTICVPNYATIIVYFLKEFISGFE